ncbi:MAG: transcriptional repressor [Deltaproteobacteria bacterium]|nr:transcriptional repressor [Deltaproteobacteria bacterium]
MELKPEKSVPARHDHQNCIDTALQEAERVLEDKGARMTGIRRLVLQYIWRNHCAVKAYDILGFLGDRKGSAKPPTVYRALQFLQDHGLVHRLESLNAYIGCPYPAENHNGQFLICNDCGTVKEFTTPEILRAVDIAADTQGFEVSHQTHEVLGRCQDCREQGNGLD